MPYKNIEDRRAAWRRWANKNPNKLKEHRERWRESDYYKLNKEQENLNQKYRRKIIKERGGVCEICGTKEDIHMHHKDRDNSNNSEKNLQLLCRNCHEKEHTFKLS